MERNQTHDISKKTILKVEMLERVETMAGEYKDVMVLYDVYNGYSDKLAASWCRKRGWKYLNARHIYGCEAQCVVLLECLLWPELITRGRNMLIIFNRR